MKLSYKQQLFTYFFIIFTLFTISIIVIEQREEVKQRTEELEDRLDSYAEMIHSYIEKHQLSDNNIAEVLNIAEIMPMDIRVSIIDNEGKVSFDKNISNASDLDNHLDRPEIRSALYQEKGSDCL